MPTDTQTAGPFTAQQLQKSGRDVLAARQEAAGEAKKGEENEKEMPKAFAQARIRSLYAELDRATLRFGLLLASAWLFAIFSYYLSRKTGADWFSRSGSVMGLIGAVTSFKVAGVYLNELATAFKEGLVSVPREIALTLEPPKSYRALAYCSYLTGVVGTGVWGYGDLLLHLVS